MAMETLMHLFLSTSTLMLLVVRLHLIMMRWMGCRRICLLIKGAENFPMELLLLIYLKREIGGRIALHLLIWITITIWTLSS